MSTIAFVGCVKAKRPGVQPAGEKYISTLFTLSRQYAEAHADRWYILSAKHGLLRPEEPIDDYDETLKDMNAQARRSWANRVAAQIGREGVLQRGDRVLWLAGRDYKDFVEAQLPLVEHLDPMRGLGIGSRLGWLSREVRGGGVAAQVEIPAARVQAPPAAVARESTPESAGGRPLTRRGSKYDPLNEHLAAQGDARITLSFAEVERILGFELPRSAYEHQAWWASRSAGAHVHARAWLDAGYRVASVQQSRANGMVTFERA